MSNIKLLSIEEANVGNNLKCRYPKKYVLLKTHNLISVNLPIYL